MNALILFSHGSVLCGSGEALEAHAERLRARGEWDRVEIGYLNYSEPRFAESVDRLAREGVTEIIVTPYFLVSGYFVTSSLPKELAKIREAHPHIAFSVAEAMKDDAGLVDALLDAAATTRPRERWRDGLLQATASCTARSECPLYGTPVCPLAPGPIDAEAEPVLEAVA